MIYAADSRKAESEKNAHNFTTRTFAHFGQYNCTVNDFKKMREKGVRANWIENVSSFSPPPIIPHRLPALLARP